MLKYGNFYEKKMNKNTLQAQTVMFHHKISDTTSQQFGKE